MPQDTTTNTRIRNEDFEKVKRLADEYGLTIVQVYTNLLRRWEASTDAERLLAMRNEPVAA